MVEYRKAVEKDRARIEALFIEMLQTIYHTDDVEGYEVGYLDRYFSDHEDKIIVAVDNGQVVAFLSVQVFRGDNYIYLDDLSVTARYRDQGIGGYLIKSAENYANEIGISAIVFHVESSNERAHALYKRLGYKDDLKDGSRIRMAKDGLSKAFEKSCGAIVYTTENGIIKYLLVEEASGFHSFPKGHMENGETEKETAIHEIKEETDLDATLISDFIDDYTFSFCKGCRSCHSTAKCVIEDDIQVILDEFDAADVIVSVSPSYWADIPGQYKAFIDRCTPWCNTHEPHATIRPGKRGYAIALRTGPSMPECERIIKSIEHFYGHLEIQAVNSLGLCSVEYKENVEPRKREIIAFCEDI